MSRVGRLGGVAASVLLTGALVLWARGAAGDAMEPLTRTAEPDSAAVVALLRQARGTSPVLCHFAGRALEGRYGRHGMISEITLEGDPLSAALERWADRGLDDPAAVAPLRAALDDGDACVRSLGARLLGRTEVPRARAALLDALRAPSPSSREAAALGLGLVRHRDEAVERALIGALADREGLVRGRAAWALGRLECRTAVDGLVGVLGDAEPRVRAQAAIALGEIEDARAIPALARSLREDREPSVRKSAAWALGEMD